MQGMGKIDTYHCIELKTYRHHRNKLYPAGSHILYSDNIIAVPYHYKLFQNHPSRPISALGMNFQ